MSFDKGEEIDIVETSDPDWWEVRKTTSPFSISSPGSLSLSCLYSSPDLLGHFSQDQPEGTGSCQLSYQEEPGKSHERFAWLEVSMVVTEPLRVSFSEPYHVNGECASSRVPFFICST